jgi:hypothetical protein
MKIENKSLKYISMAAALTGMGFLAASAFQGCAASGGMGPGGSLTSSAITGTLSQLSATSTEEFGPLARFMNTYATTGTTVNVNCGTAGTFTGTVNASTGSFSVPGVPLNTPCTFSFTSTSTGAIKCQVSFQDTTNYDLNHNNMSSNTTSLNNNMGLGGITCDTTGNISLTASNVQGAGLSSNVAASSAFDFTGTYSTAAYTGTLPTGYKTIQTTCTNGGCGPTVGQPVTLIRFHGKTFTPTSGTCTPAINATCPVTSGTVGTADGYAMSIWGGDYAHGIGACGANTGFTADEARAYAQLSLDTTAPSLSGNQLNYAHYSWSTPSGFGTDTGWTQPWMYGGATNGWPIYDCTPVTIPASSGSATKSGMGCFVQGQYSNAGVPTGDGTYLWQVGMQNSGGCVDANNNPVNVTNWSNLTIGTCTSSTSSFNSNFTTNSCTYNASIDGTSAPISFTCSYTGGTFKDLSGLTGSGNDNGPDFTNPSNYTAGHWSGQPVSLLGSGVTCADGANTEATYISNSTTVGTAITKAAWSKKLLARYQCYANAYWSHTSNGAGSTSCARNYNFNWGATSYANFISGDDRSMKPQNAFITDRVFYSPDGQWAFLKNVNTQYVTLNVQGGSQLCPMAQTTVMKFHPTSSSQVLVDYQQTTAMTDLSATCQGAVSAALAGGGTSSDPNLNNLYNQLQTQKLIFNLNH